MAKKRNKKAPLRDEIRRLEKLEKHKRKADGLIPQISKTTEGGKDLLLQINGPKRVNLQVTPELYKKAIRLIEANNTVKMVNDPLSSKFWYGLLDDHENAKIILAEKREELDQRQFELNLEYDRWRFKK